MDPTDTVCLVTAAQGLKSGSPVDLCMDGGGAMFFSVVFGWDRVVIV